MKTYKLGKLPASNQVKFKLSSFIDPSAFPKVPKSFGHESLVANFEMLGNDNYGDCVWAGAAHETMIWNACAGRGISFSDKSVLSDYSAVTGFNPSDESTDQGTDMKAAASYRRTTGVIDAAGNRHKIAAYLSITPGNLQEHYIAMYLFGAVGIGILFPGYAMDQFNQNKPWSVKQRGALDGGHYIPLVAKRSNIECVTWGRIQKMTVGFFGKYNDESLCYVSEEMLTNNKSPEGFDAASLIKYLNQLK
jgi:hypothetical protein